MEPPYITLKSPYGGFGLKTRTSEAACHRVDDLLAAHGVDVELRELELRVAEPCPRPLADTIGGRLLPPAAGSRTGSRTLARPADELVREHGHAIGPVASEAWAAFGAPPLAGADQSTRPPYSSVMWTWSIARDVARATATYPSFCTFMHRHQAPMMDTYASAVAVHGVWSFRLHSAARGVAGPPYPPSEIRASLAGRHASAFLDLVFPYDAPVADFVQDFRDVCHALGMKLPPGALRRCSPTRAGGRKWTKLSLPGGAGGLHSP